MDLGSVLNIAITDLLDGLSKSLSAVGDEQWKPTKIEQPDGSSYPAIVDNGDVEIAKFVSFSDAAVVCRLKNEMIITQEVIKRLRDHRNFLMSVMNTPRTDDFFAAVRGEAAHQISRWGTEHDAGKTNSDWFTLILGLQGKAVKAYWDNDEEKLKHHIVSTAAALLNWLRALNGETTTMRPG